MKSVLICRTDSIGDVILTLPMAGAIKAQYPACQVGFVGRKYTEAVIKSSRFVDHFFDKDALIDDPTLLDDLSPEIIIYAYPEKHLAKALHRKAPLRIGTSHRWFHWLYANKRISFSRRKSNLHEAQLNFKLFQPLGISDEISIEQIPNLYGMRAAEHDFEGLIYPNEISIILHPKSQGSAMEWPLHHYLELAEQLPDHYQVFVSGTAHEAEMVKAVCPELLESENVTDVMGRFSLQEYVRFIGNADGLIACSTGPLHIASAMGKLALGIYPPYRPIHPGRWRPIGENACVLTAKGDELAPRHLWNQDCLGSITPHQVAEKLQQHLS